MALTKVQKEGIETLINNNADNRVITGSGTANTLNGESNVVIDSSGNLGIGAGTPRQKLHISASDSSSANMVFTNSTTGTSAGDGFIVGITGGEDAQLNMQESANLKFSTADTERMRIDSSGNVGIGTSSPSSFNSDGRNLVVGTGSGGQGLSIYSANNNYGNIYFADGTSDGSYNAGGILYNHSSNFMRFDTAAAERMRIDSSGRLLVGTTTEGNGDADEFTIANTSGANMGMTIRSGTGALGNIFFSDGTSGGSEYRGMIQYGHNNDSMRFATAETERMRIDSSGILNIGSTGYGGGGATPILYLRSTSGRQVKIHSTIAATCGMQLSNSTTGEGEDSGFQLAVLGTGDGYINNPASKAIRFSTANTERMRITSAGHFLFSCTSHLDAGDVGIKLHESSSTPYITNTIDTTASNSSYYHLYNKNSSNNGYRFYVQQNGGVYNFSGNNFNLSDEREKKNITLMGSVYNTFKQFVFKDFNYISENDSVTKKHGLIAQDVESIDSDLVSEDFKASVDSEGNDVLRKGLREEQFMMIGFKALQEAIAKIEVLETKVAALEAA